jgi:hypothetical protein
MGGDLATLTSQGKFKIPGSDRLRELNQPKALREGMIAEAKREFQILVNRHKKILQRKQSF